MAQGIVNWYSPNLGYGFIIPDEQRNERIFVRHTDIARSGGFETLENGDRVSYEVVRGREGKEATNVSRA